jgi:hypothetical protein
MRHAPLILLIAFVATAGFAQMHHEAIPASGLAQFKTLVGSWKGTDPEGKPLSLSYKMVSEDKTLMETLGMGGKEESMITMYHLDNDGVMATHYCSIGNQPRMRLDRKKSNESRFAFVYQDATNLKSKKDPHINGLTITVKDKDHIFQEWSMIEKGKETREIFTFKRVD